MPQLPSVDEALGAIASPQLPTVDEVLAPVEEYQSPLGLPSLSSWRVPSEPAAQRIFNSFVGTAARAFGPESLSESADKFGLSLPAHTEEALRKSGFWNDYAKGQQDVRKEFMERTFKATMGTLATTMRAGSAILAAPFGVGAQILEDIGLMSKEDAESAAADPGLMMAAGPFGEPLALMVNARRAANLRVTIPKARANGLLAEGQAGAFEAVPLTPENALARAQAANEAGIPTPIPEAVAPDVHALARRVDPPVFEQYDALEAAKGAHRETIQTLAAAREALPEAVQAQDEINTILGKVHGVEERLTNKARARLEAAQARLEAVLSQDTPEMAKARKALLDADIAQRDLVPTVASAYRQAREMMPPVTKQVAEVTEELSAGKLPEEVGLPPVKEVQVPDVVAVERMEPPKVPAGKLPTSGSGLKAIQGTGPLKTRGLSENIEASAIEANLTQSFGDLPEYHQLSMADQARLATEFVATKPDEALAVALGEKAAPKGLSPASVLVMVEKQAQAAGDVETLRRLAIESRLTTTATEAGRFIRILGERDPTSAAGAMHLVQEARRAALEKRNATALKDAAKEIKAVIRKNYPKRDAWIEMVNSLPICPE